MCCVCDSGPYATSFKIHRPAHTYLNTGLQNDTAFLVHKQVNSRCPVFGDNLYRPTSFSEIIQINLRSGKATNAQLRLSPTSIYQQLSEHLVMFEYDVPSARLGDC